MPFEPRSVYIQEDALEYPLGKALLEHFRSHGPRPQVIPSRGRIAVRGATPGQKYVAAKATLVVAVKESLQFQTCKPSAHYQLPLVTSCPGLCEYCYLNTRLGPQPYIRVYVNIDEILEAARRLIEKHRPRVTVFEGAATSDPVPTERFTGSLARTVAFFGRQERGRFRFVTKFPEVDPLLGLEHRSHTRVRFSINTPRIIAQYEHLTPDLEERLAAARKVAAAGYPTGFIVAPVIAYDRWEDEYRLLLDEVAAALGTARGGDVTFEVISHRFTARAKTTILSVFPGTSLPMEEGERKVKFGQFGYRKFVYPEATLSAIKAFFEREIPARLPGAGIEYII